MSDSRAVVTFEDVKLASENGKALIIDVRDPTELNQTGEIPKSVNIPLGQVKDVLGLMPTSKFQELFGREKPEKDHPLIFSCRLGRRADAAQDTAIELGFTNTKSYQGSWTDWESKINK